MLRFNEHSIKNKLNKEVEQKCVCDILPEKTIIVSHFS